MSIALIDYGCHSFTYRLANKLKQKGLQVKYLVNGSLESPNLNSLTAWTAASPDLVQTITCSKPYGKMSLRRRLSGELEWGRNCAAVLEQARPDTVIVSCVPLTAMVPVRRWAASKGARFVYWLQDIQSRAIHDLLGRKLGMPGRTLGAFANIWEQELMEHSEMVITISAAHEKELPAMVRRTGRHVLLENWANVEDIPQHDVDNPWSARHGLNQTVNVVYSGTLGMKHDLGSFIALAQRFKMRPDVRVVIVSSGQAADTVRQKAESAGLSNLIVLPFQAFSDVPMVLASAAVLIAPLDASASTFCVPSKILSYLCAGRPTVIAIDESNSAALMIRRANAGSVVEPGKTADFVAAVQAYLDNQDQCIATGKSARAYAEATFELDNVAGRFIDVLQRANPALRPALSYAATQTN
jgi:glycosyltransferase involved in cell wall biosynthesis